MDTETTPQIDSTPSAEHEAAHSVPVSQHDTSAAPAPSTRSGRTSSKKPATTDERFSASMEAAYDRSTGDKSGQQPATTDLSASDTIPFPDHKPPELAPPPSIGNRLGVDIWASLPREAQLLMMEREREAADKISQQGQELATLRSQGGASAEIGGVIEKFAHHIPRDQNGNMAPPQMILESLLSAHDALQTNPVAALQWLARSAGVDLSQLGSNPQASAQHQQQLAQYRAAFQQLQFQQQQQQHQRVQYLQEQIMDYMKDEVHEPAVEEEMARQLEAVRATNPRLFNADPMAAVKQAHSRALAFVPGADRKAAAEAKRKADEAKRLGSMNLKSNIGKSPTSVSKDIWSNDSWGSVYDKVQRR